jgi:tRNA(Ile)-lysidine synthase
MQRGVMAGQALSSGEFATLMPGFAPFPPNRRLAVAVSGGPDSMALAFTLKRWCEQGGFPPPEAFIVDHKLRAESAAEAAVVWRRLEAQGVAAEILSWEHPPVASQLHSAARKARYRLLLEACHRHGIASLLFAHQREDQAETVLMRLAKGTGLDGLAGIPEQSMMEGVQILRPFLGVPKERLIATCQAANIPFVTDPSNDGEKFARGRLRRVMPMLAEEGLTIERLLDFSRRAAEAKDALDHYAVALLREASRQDVSGVIHVGAEALFAAPRAIALRVLGMALQAVHGEDYAPQRASLILLLDALQSADALPPRTLHGCLIGRNKGHVTIIREYAGITETPSLRAGESVVWDGRWRVSLASGIGAETYRIKPLGHPPHDMLDRLSPDLRHKIPQGRVRAALPALWLEDDLAFIPSFVPNHEAEARLLTNWPARRNIG